MPFPTAPWRPTISNILHKVPICRQCYKTVYLRDQLVPFPTAPWHLTISNIIHNLHKVPICRQCYKTVYLRDQLVPFPTAPWHLTISNIIHNLHKVPICRLPPADMCHLLSPPSQQTLRQQNAPQNPHHPTSPLGRPDCAVYSNAPAAGLSRQCPA
jgi:ribosomal protein L40E